jgi:hypothetical protein
MWKVGDKVSCNNDCNTCTDLTSMLLASPSQALMRKPTCMHTVHEKQAAVLHTPYGQINTMVTDHLLLICIVEEHMILVRAKKQRMSWR